MICVEFSADMHLNESETTKHEACEEKNETITESIETVVKLSQEGLDGTLLTYIDSQTTISDISTQCSEPTIEFFSNRASPAPPVLTDPCDLNTGDIIALTVVKTKAASLEENAEQVEVKVPKIKS